MKVCTKCGIEKNEEEFYKHKGFKDGLNYWCKQCQNQQDKQWNQNNKEYRKQHSKQWYQNNKEYRKQYIKQWNQNNKEKIKQYNKQWNQNNKEYHKQHKQQDPFFKLTCQIRTRIGNSFQRGGYSKKSHTFQLLQCSYKQFMCLLGPKPPGDVHLDHICPCSQAQNEEELIKLQHHTNFRWLPANENIAKSDNKTPEAEELCQKLLKRDWRI